MGQTTKKVLIEEEEVNIHQHDEVFEPEIPWFTAMITFFGYGLLIFFGYLRDFFGYFFKRSEYRKGFAPLLKDFEDFYTRRLYHRINDCWNRPITGCPGSHIAVLERKKKTKKYSSDLELTGERINCINLGSYNYLGFGDPDSPTKDAVLEVLDTYGVSTCADRSGMGTTLVHDELEKLVARYLGKKEAFVFGMGFGTNQTTIPAIVGKGGLIISDSMNHSSIVCGARSSGAKVKVFKHNNPKDLEAVLRSSIVEGQPRTRRPWKKILIMVEGIYSMEGEMCPLPAIVALKKKYKAYLYVDEAHSIGAIGRTGRGICEYKGVDPEDIDILMGTFTKSFGAVGGYVASSKQLIAHIRNHCVGSLYSNGISIPAAQQCISALSIIAGEDGTDLGKTKLLSLRANANYFRQKMMDMGCHTLGNFDSPVIPVMLYNPAKISAFSRECLKRNLAVVVVGFPASPLLLSRARFCISAAHTRKDLDIALKKIEEVAILLNLKYMKNWPHN